MDPGRAREGFPAQYRPDRDEVTKTIMNALRILDQGVLYRNPHPGHKAVIAYAPFVQPLSGEELICVFRYGQAMYSRDGMIHQLRSRDGGKTWEHEGPIRDRSRDDSHYNYRGAQITALHDGSLVMKVNRAEHSDPDHFYFNQETGGISHCQTLYLHSFDGGRTWSDPPPASLPSMPSGLEPAADGPAIELEDGNWMQIFETWKSYDNAGSHLNKTFALFSSDAGRSWGDWVDVADGTGEDRSYSHGSFIRLSNGRLLGSLWTGNLEMTQFFDLHFVTSLDASGQTWSRPRASKIPGQTSGVLEMGSGQLVLVYSHRENTDQPGIKVIFSEDGGETWSPDPVVVWDAYGKEALGVPRTDRYPSSHDVIAYGAPHIIGLTANELMVSFWCTQSGDTHARYCRLRLDGN